MSLQETIEELKKGIEEAKEREGQEPAQEEEKTEESVEEDEKAEEEKLVEEKKEEEPDSSAYARMRREAAASKKLADERAREIEELKRPKETEENEAAPLTAELENVIQDYRTNQAEREFKRFENEVRKNDPKYDAVTAEYAQALAGSFRVQNPRLSPEDIAELTKRTLLEKAGAYVRAGYSNPVEELYHEAKELGFTGKSFDKKEEVEKEIKPDMKKVAENRKKSTGMAASSGESKTDITRQYIMQNGMPTNAEWSKMSAAQKKSLMYG